MGEVKIIESGLGCDNIQCNWEDKTILREDYLLWVNKLCPNCGEILLTEEDFSSHKELIEIINFVNTFSGEDLKEYNMMLDRLSLNEKSNLLNLIHNTEIGDLENALNALTEGEDRECSMEVKVHKGVNILGIKILS